MLIRQSVWLGCVVSALACGLWATEARGGLLVVVPAAKNEAAGDIRSPFSSAGLGGAGTTNLKAYSRQDPPAAAGPNATVTSTLNGAAGPAPKTLNGASTGIDIPNPAPPPRFNRTPPPVVALQNQPKRNITANGDIQTLRSTSGSYSGVAGQEQGVLNGAGVRSVFAYGIRNAGAVAPGQAAGGAFDPFTVPSGASYSYQPIIDVLMQSDLAELSVGVGYFAVDSFVFTSDTVDNFTDDGSPSSGSLWTLGISASGPVASPSGLNIDFELNPQALDEISFPTSFLVTLPGYSGSLTHAQLAPLINTAINTKIRGAFAVDSNGVASVNDFSFLPAGTMYTPMGGDVVYGDGVNAGVQAAPEPSSLMLAGSAMLSLVLVRIRRYLYRPKPA